MPAAPPAAPGVTPAAPASGSPATQNQSYAPPQASTYPQPQQLPQQQPQPQPQAAYPNQQPPAYQPQQQPPYPPQQQPPYPPQQQYAQQTQYPPQQPPYPAQPAAKKRKVWPFVAAGSGVLVLLVVVLVFVLGRPGPDIPNNNNNGDDIIIGSSWDDIERYDHSATLAERYDPNDTWAIYWYLCGSDLESRAGLASGDLQEMLRVNLPSNVQVIIEAGGAKEWKNDFDPNYNTRLLYDSNGLQLLEQIPHANMGDGATLEAFLRFCTTNYPADHQIVVFWDHGGGSISGVIFDETFGYDSLSLAELGAAFGAVTPANVYNPPFEIIGFDACLMATIETANTLSGYARFMVASEEVEPGLGWDYTGFVGALAQDTGIGGASLGRAICDSFYADCKKHGQAGDITLSVIDLSQVGALMDAYYNIGAESLLIACENSSFVTDFGRAAGRAQNYGFNNEWDGYTNMVDLGDLVWQSGESLLPQFGADLIRALDRCVVYQVMGPYRDRASGLACFYNYSGSVSDYKGYADMHDDDPFRWYYYYELAGELNAEGLEYLQHLAFIYEPDRTLNPEAVEGAETDDLEDWPILAGEDGAAVLNLGKEIADKLVSVYGYLAYLDPHSNIGIFLGRNNDMDADWENGVFREYYRGVWGCIDDHLVYMELTDETDDYQLYMVPVLLNGEEYSMSVSYTFATGAYEILGARQGLDENGMADRNLRLLEPGDVLEPLHYVLMDTPNAEFEQRAIERFTVTENTSFFETELGDGMFFYMFEMCDRLGNYYLSKIVIFNVENGNVTLDVDI